MSPYEITYPGGSVEHWNEKPGVFYINKLVNYFDKVIWLNPEQKQNWQYSQSTMILRDLLKKNMFQMKYLLNKKRRGCGRENLKCLGIIENLKKISLRNKIFES